MNKEKTNFIISAVFTIGALALALFLYWIDCKNWIFLFVKDVSVGIFSGAMVSTVVLYFILKNKIIEINNEFCYCLNELLEVYEYALDLNQLPFDGMVSEKYYDLLESINENIQKLEYEKLLNRETLKKEAVSKKIVKLEIALKGDFLFKEKIFDDYFEILGIIKKLSHKPKNFSMKYIKEECEKKLLRVEQYKEKNTKKTLY